ncbi:hypothetical protein QTP88_013339 [Uroleucon formosanum]
MALYGDFSSSSSSNSSPPLWKSAVSLSSYLYTSGMCDARIGHAYMTADITLLVVTNYDPLKGIYLTIKRRT